MRFRQHLGKDVPFERMPFGQNHYLVFGFHYSFPEVRLYAKNSTSVEYVCAV